MPQLSYSAAVEEIKSRCSIVDVISPVVPLTRKGSNYWGCCPFHKEKTPSFSVSETRQYYHCFGCGEHGDAIKFVMKYYNLSFTEAVEKLASQYGIEIQSYGERGGKSREPYYDLNRQAGIYWLNAFRNGNNPGREYMKKRRIDDETLNKFGIGYADDNWTSLTDALLQGGASREMLVELGLCSQKDSRIYDKFRSRVIFPIINTRNKIIGFGGRIIGDEEPKYLNSQESLIFEKKNNLYGLNLSRSEIQQQGYAVLVEGYMDVVSLYQSGVRNVAASLGTSLTEQQARLLSRYTRSVVLCYDADRAGIKAALRGIEVLRGAGMEVRVLHVDDGKDPDEYIKKHGRDAFIELIDRAALSDVDYKMALIARKYDYKDTKQSIRFFQAAADVLKALPPVESEVYIKKIASKYGFSEGALRNEVLSRSGKEQQSIQIPRSQSEPEERRDPEKPSVSSGDILMEKTLIRLMMLKSSYYGALLEFPSAFVTGEGRGIVQALGRIYSKDSEFDQQALKDSLSDSEYSYLQKITAEIQTGGAEDKVFEDCVRRLRLKEDEARIEEIKGMLSSADPGTDPENMNMLTLELQQLLAKRRP